MEYSDFVALSNVEGTPTKYTREPATNRILLHPVPTSGTVLELKYYAEFTALTSDSSTNEISDIGRFDCVWALAMRQITLLMNVRLI